ncbi:MULTISPECIES: ABC transporter substrate-binding protein [Halanaerobium]|uniref:ABC-type nitrate/sulfonate/bicarbonate transport system substrate-binding protein n=1 Tax=Halanaerobium congolense TaxID=54121 RepID=A0A1G6T9P1_9FIRM|nr:MULTISPECIES: hypothetical protein [Halanaerobium]TDS35471.1 ABC-type nitrate/sulfonate/bicarbonate transport system substrate-binding protein [Halanaerobium congolense]SDD25761.1 ABC-type nitrate/sulfonate/bicarbonate transport system, substrate-binding protein [Halanaerobium congolense]
MEYKNLSATKYFIIILLTVLMFLITIPVVAEDSIKISVSSSPSSLPAFYIQDNSDSVDLNVSIHRSRNVVISKLMQGEIEAALLSTNEAVKLYNRGVEVQLLGIHNWGLFYLLTTNQDIINWDTLKNKKLYIPDKGGPLDIVFQELAAKKNLDLKNDLKVERGKMREVAQLMINNMAETAVIREPFASQIILNNDQSKIVFDIQDEWEKEYNFRIAQSALVVRKDFAEKNKELLLKLEKEYQKAVKNLGKDNKLAADLALKYLELSPEVTLKSYPELNLNYQNIAEVKKEVISYLEVLKSYNKETIGGRLPDAEFYFSY